MDSCLAGVYMIAPPRAQLRDIVCSRSKRVWSAALKVSVAVVNLSLTTMRTFFALHRPRHATHTQRETTRRDHTGRPAGHQPGWLESRGD